jgi:putative hydrolase of HD superfamily
VPNAESVAAHSYGVAFVVLMVAPQLDDPVDLGRALAMAVLHDLPEALTSDIPAPAWRLMPEGIKGQTEEQAIRQIVGDVAAAEQLLLLWREMKQCQTVEAQVVSDADKIDLFLQALRYEEQSGNRRLAEFWQRPAHFYFPQTRVLYEALQKRRQ